MKKNKQTTIIKVLGFALILILALIIIDGVLNKTDRDLTNLSQANQRVLDELDPSDDWQIYLNEQSLDSQRTLIDALKEYNDSNVEVYSYNMDEMDFEKIEISKEKQDLIFDQVNELEKSEDLYIDGNYQGLESAYDDRTYLVKILGNDSFDVEIVEGHAYPGDDMYWYNIKSDNKDIEGIYKASYDLKSRIDNIIGLDQ